MRTLREERKRCFSFLLRQRNPAKRVLSLRMDQAGEQIERIKKNGKKKGSAVRRS